MARVVDQDIREPGSNPTGRLEICAAMHGHKLIIVKYC